MKVWFGGVLGDLGPAVTVFHWLTIQFNLPVRVESVR